MIIQELKAEFNEYFQSQDAELILWIDPTSQWKGVIEHLSKDVRLIEYRGSQLEVKAEVELTWEKGGNPKFVLYLAGLARDKLTVLKEYEFSGKVFEETIPQAFRRWGIEFERQYQPALEKILPIAISQFATKGKAFWKDRLTPKNVRGLLFDDEAVRRMLAAPEITTIEFKNNDTYEIFCDYIDENYGGPKVSDYDPNIWAQRFTVYLLLTEVRRGSGRLSTFPKFDVGWADEMHENKCLSFTRDWLRNATYKEDFKRLAGEIEKIYDLTAWASGLQDSLPCEASLRVEDIFENHMINQLNNLKTLSDLRTLLSEKSKLIDDMASHFWSREGELAVWRALNIAKYISEGIDRATEDMSGIGSTGLLAQRYSDSWWQIDRDYRKFRYQFDGEDRVTALSSQISTLYREFQNKLNEKFLDFLAIQKELIIEDIEHQNSFWAKTISASKRKRAVFLVDALRFDIACDLVEKLREQVRDAEVKLQTLAASVPTLTAIGMSSILPLEDIHVAVSDGNWEIRGESKKDTGNLAILQERKKLLKKRHPRALFYNLEDILSPGDLDFGEGNPIIIFTREMDGLGHDSGILNLSLDYVGQYIQGLARAIKRLGMAGIVEVHVVSDHGFIILDDIGEADKIPISKDADVFYRGHRCLVGRNFSGNGSVIFDLPGSDGLQIAVPRGIGVFRSRGSNEFFHGGVSPQELLIPHIEIMFAKALPKYGVKLSAPEKIYNLIFEVELLRAIPGEGVLFGSPRFVEVIGMIVRDEGVKEIIKQSGPDLVVDESHETLKVRLRIKPGTGHRFGDILRLDLRDADTGELLDNADISIEVESDE